LEHAAKVHVVDSHTGGEPTRIVIAGGPDLGNDSLESRLRLFRDHHDHFRSAVVNEPRGSDALVGGLLCEPLDSSSSAGVIFFNNVGYLGMCGHGTIGLAVTLAHLGRIKPGVHFIETPVGVVRATLHEDSTVTVANVPSYRLAKNVSVEVEGSGIVTGDIAWGGNWFFLTSDKPVPLTFANVDLLTDFAWRVRQALSSNGITGECGAKIDHIEITGEAFGHNAHSRNFVLCPGKSYDRSPCGTGTSAKLACLYADGKLREGQIWIQESITGSIFEGSVVVRHGSVHPSIKGSAFVNAEAHLILNEHDPLIWGIRSSDSRERGNRSTVSSGLVHSQQVGPAVP
jgi:4-hydroxyproline epimerase